MMFPLDCCPVCGEPKVCHHLDRDGFHQSHDPEYLEPDEDWCDMCGFVWVQTDPDTSDKLSGIEDMQDDVIRTIRKWQKHGRKVIRRIAKMREAEND